MRRLPLPAWPAFRGGTGLAWQLALAAAAWLFLCGLHPDNDGLWYQGDAPRHAANGLFYKDFLLTRPHDPADYWMRYYARYPVINPLAYPPVFYLLEAPAFALLGPSPFAAKGLVLAFSLLAALYATAWLRRWLAPEAGWLGALLPLLPGFVSWSHAVMLNVPAAALSLAALYHARRWLEADGPPASRHGYAAAVLTVLAIFTHYTAGVVVLIAAAWLPVLRPPRRPPGRRAVAAGLGAALLVALGAVAVLRLAPRYAPVALPGLGRLVDAPDWSFYPLHAREVCSLHLLVLAGLGLAGGLVSRRWRREALLLLLGLAVTYALFSCLWAKESRYVLLAGGPLLGGCALAVLLAARGVQRMAKGRPGAAGATVLAIALALVVTQSGLAWQRPVPAVHGIREAAAFLAEVAPAEPVLYEGYYNGVFTFYVRAGDPAFERRVVLGNKLLYELGLAGGYHLREFVSSPQEVVGLLQARGGCRWLALERGGPFDAIATARHLQEAVKGPQFELVRSFPISAAYAERIEVYRLLVPVAPVEEVEVPFPVLNGEARHRVQPLPGRGGGAGGGR
jgi:hypothetical protein